MTGVQATRKTALKICGVTNVEDARLVGTSGADYCGILVDVGFSERSLTLTEAQAVAAASGIANVLLMCNPTPEAAAAAVTALRPAAVQLQCHEPPALVQALKAMVDCQIWKAVHLPVPAGQATVADYVDAGVDALVIDSIDSSEGFLRMGGTGRVGDWGVAAAVVATVDVPVFLAGGINPDNVARAVATVRPAGIDLCSGVEAYRGKKDPAKVRTLVENFRTAAGLDG